MVYLIVLAFKSERLIQNLFRHNNCNVRNNDLVINIILMSKEILCLPVFPRRRNETWSLDFRERKCRCLKTCPRIYLERKKMKKMGSLGCYMERHFVVWRCHLPQLKWWRMGAYVKWNMQVWWRRLEVHTEFLWEYFLVKRKLENWKEDGKNNI